MNIEEIFTVLEPREKLLLYGAKYLSDRELIEILISTGVKGRNKRQVAGEVLELLKKESYKVNMEGLLDIPGMGIAKASIVAGALEFARRVFGRLDLKIESPEDVLPLLSRYAERKQEYFLTISLSGANEVIKTRVVSKGTLNQVSIHPREVFASPLKERAAALICAHNHPGGSLSPSPEDIRVTHLLEKAGKLLGIPLLDHIIFTPRGYYSFNEEGLLHRTGGNEE